MPTRNEKRLAAAEQAAAKIGDKRFKGDLQKLTVPQLERLRDLTVKARDAAAGIEGDIDLRDYMPESDALELEELMRLTGLEGE